MERNVLPQARKFTEFGVYVLDVAPDRSGGSSWKRRRLLAAPSKGGRGPTNHHDIPPRHRLGRAMKRQSLSICARIRPAPEEFKGRVVLVTGAGGGIGRAVSLLLPRAGAEVILLGRTVRKLEGVHAEIQQAAGAGSQHRCLLIERALAADGDESVAAAIQKRYGRLDGLLHNAALLGTLMSIEEDDVPTFMRVMHVNVTAASCSRSTCCHCCARRRKRRCCSRPVASASAAAPSGRVCDLEIRGRRNDASARARDGRHDANPREHHRPGKGPNDDAPPGLSF